MRRSGKMFLTNGTAEGAITNDFRKRLFIDETCRFALIIWSHTELADPELLEQNIASMLT
jgi:hypothetical protein